MAFLFQDQNQGTRNSDSHAKPRELPQPFSFIRTLTVGFGIAPNLLTLLREKKALAGLGYVTLTAGGDFHPALRTSAALNGRPDTNMAKRRGFSKRLPPRNLHVPMPAEQGSGQFPAARRRLDAMIWLNRSVRGLASPLPLAGEHRPPLAAVSRRTPKQSFGYVASKDAILVGENSLHAKTANRGDTPTPPSPACGGGSAASS